MPMPCDPFNKLTKFPQSEFAVDMTCQDCVKAVSSALRDIPGIERWDIDLEGKRVTIVGRTPPSHLLSALKSTNRQVIVRGASAASAAPLAPAQAAVSILESPLPLPTSMASTTNSILAAREASLPGMNEEEHSQKVFGICRFVQIAPRLVLMDLTVRLPPPANVGLAPARRAFNVYISSTGNLIDPPTTTGKPFINLGQIVPDKEGYGDLFKEVDGELWEWIGRGCIVEAESNRQPSSPTRSQGAPSTLGKIFAGVVARSAGAWGNDKTVCACSGRTMWEEDREMEKKILV
ncbi:superoxide dismutase [Naematelia encephala]|uniref:Superoxide dismutase 1 copper chaperone n=1 Tax=Naematelia encephala TaxID=71784 RepID=A0A1Y2BJK5_9TREE|nr:superoxide dismutase [Naematelia encephala]